VDVLLNWIWQGSVIAAAAAIILVAIERSRARDRYLTVWAALLSVLALPIVGALGAASFVPASAVVLPGMLTSGPAGSVGAPLLSVPSAWWTSNAMIAALWLLWSACATARLLFATQWLRRIKRASFRLTEARQARLRHWVSVMWRGRRTDLMVCDGVHAAAVLGGGSPTIALAPTLLERLDDEDLDHIVIHEWAHVQRRDDLLQLLQSGISVVAGWHPAVWWLDRQLRIEREIACDEMAVAVTGSAKGYAASLVKLASLQASPPVTRTALTAVGPGGLRRRIIRIMSRDHGATAVSWRFAAAAASALLCVLAIVLGDVRAIEATVERELAPPVSTGRRSNEPIGSTAPSIARSDPASMVVRRETRQAAASDPTRNRPRVVTVDPIAVDTRTRLASSRLVEPSSEPQAEAIGASRMSGAFSAATPRTLTSGGTATAAGPIVPWRRAAAGSTAAGVALGQQSHAAAVVSAGYFTRLGKRIGGSF
jgi:bla regulator protein blaR1